MLSRAKNLRASSRALVAASQKRQASSPTPVTVGEKTSRRLAALSALLLCRPKYALGVHLFAAKHLQLLTSLKDLAQGDWRVVETSLLESPFQVPPQASGMTEAFLVGFRKPLLLTSETSGR